MQNILKMTDISPSEVKRELSMIRYSTLLSPQVVENDEGVILTCEVNEQNRFVFAEVVRTLAEFVYADEDKSPFARICDLAEVRKLKIALVEQGTRGRLVSTLMKERESFDDALAGGLLFGDVAEMCGAFCAADAEQVARKCQQAVDADAVVVTLADFEHDPLIPSRCEVIVLVGGHATHMKYNIMGNKNQIAEQLAFYAAALLAKKIF